MKISKLLMSLCAAGAMFGLASCQSDEPLTDNGEGNTGKEYDSGESVFMSITLEMASPAGSRSQTINPNPNPGSNDGEEVGTDKENNVSTAIIVLAETGTNNLIAAGTVANGGTLTATDPTAYKATAKITKTNLSNYYSANGSEDGTLNAGKESVNIFVFCNPTAELSNYFFDNEFNLKSGLRGKAAWVDEACTAPVASRDQAVDAWKDNSFLMSNVKIATRLLPKHLDDWDTYSSESTAFDFSGANSAGTSHEVDNSSTSLTGGGSILVERVVARFDFKDGSEGDNTYDVYKRAVSDTEEPIIKIQLQRMILTNMCNKFYYLPRATADGMPLDPTGSSLCVLENRSNYLVSPYAKEYAKFTDQTVDPQTYMNYPFFNVSFTDSDQATEFSYRGENWIANYTISEVLAKEEKDNWADKSYTPWRYVTENLIPGPVENQVNGISTGVVFKGKMIAGDYLNGNGNADDQALYDALNGTITGDPAKDPILYLHNNNLYCTWEAVRNAVIAACVVFEDENNTVPKYVDVVNAAGEVVGKNLDVRTNDPFYTEVFGNGSMGTFVWNGKEYTDEPIIDPENPTEKLGQDVNSPNYLWQVWKASQTSANKSRMANAMTKSHFTLYQSSKDADFGAGYYCYYYYWNRHNDNMKPGVMGPMEFCVVRNNVYKLAVTSISKLGHPREPENDPDSPTPDTPDESDDIYFTVTCEVLPWVVRVNNIQF